MTDAGLILSVCILGTLLIAQSFVLMVCVRRLTKITNSIVGVEVEVSGNWPPKL